MSEKIYLFILRSGIYLSFLSLFWVFNNLLFPFITSKQLYFNIIIEILAVLWLAFIIKYKQWRPKMSWISYGLIAFFAVLLLSCFFSVDFNLSFWGDVERMLGVFHLLHFLLFYLIIITVFRSSQDWRNLFIVSLIASLGVSLYGLAQHYGLTDSSLGRDRIISTIGNSAYVGAYAIFNIFFALILYFKENNKSLKYGYLAAAFIAFLALIFSGTRGAYLGFAAGIFVVLLLAATINKNKKVKYVSISLFLFLVIAVAVLFSLADNNTVKRSVILSRLTHFSVADATMQTRFISWGTAWRDFASHPLLGTGHGNFAITFDKYFDPKFYSYTTTETYFDRAHNNLIDIASTTGLAGIISYLSIFAAVLYYLFKYYRQGKIAPSDLTLCLGLFTAYFIQNLVVFDSLPTYISLMLILGYIDRLVADGKPEEEEVSEEINSKEIAVWSIVGFIMLVIIFQFNIKPWYMLDGTIAGQTAFSKGDIISGIDHYREALSYGTVLDRDSRASMINYLAGNTSALSQLDREKAKEILDFVIEQAEKNIKYNPADSMMQMQLAMILNTASLAHSDNANEFYYYSDRALEAINKSIAASPGRTTIYFTKAQIYIVRNEKDKAIETLKYAVGLNPDYGEPYCNLAKTYFYYKDNDSGYQYIDKCLDLSGASSLGYADILRSLLDHYSALKDWRHVVVLYQKYTQLEPQNTQIIIELAKAYKELGDKERAIETANKVSEINPQLKASVSQFIDSLK